MTTPDTTLFSDVCSLIGQGRERAYNAVSKQTIETMMAEINRIIAMGYEPNHDDGVPVSAAPLQALIAHRAWNKECGENMEKLQSGEYDWSHLAMSLYPARISEKNKKDWCMALTHGLEYLCENKPKEKKTRKKKGEVVEQMLNFE